MRTRRAGSPWTTADLAALCGGLACLLGVAGVAFVSLVFLLVGESEDREYGGGPR